MAEGLAQAAVESPDVPGDEQGTAQGDAKIGSQFLVLKHRSPLPQHEQIVAGEVDTEQEHEHGGHVLQIRAVAGKRVIADTKAAGARGAESVAHRLKGGHTAKEQEADVCNGEDDVEKVQNCGGFPHFGYQLSHAGAGAFRSQQVHGKALALVSTGNDGQQEHQNTHTAHPVAEAAPIEDALGQPLYGGENGSAGGGKAGDDFKQRINKPGNGTGKQERQAPRQT